MSSPFEAVALRRRLRTELRRARKEAQLTQKDIADRLDWSPSKIIRIESGTVAVSQVDIRAMLTEYEVTDPETIAHFVDMAKKSKHQPWSQYKNELTFQTIQYFGYEASASKIRTYQLSLVPGLLQTEEYARSLLDTYQITDDRRDRIIQARLERQEILDQPHPPQMHFLIDEAVIRRVVGGPKVMRAQLLRLLELSERPEITVQLIPFVAGAHVGLDGPFNYLEFPDPDDDDVLYIEGHYDADAFVRDDPDIVSRHLQFFLDMEGIACRPEDVRGYLTRAIEQLSSAIDARNAPTDSA